MLDVMCGKMWEDVIRCEKISNITRRQILEDLLYVDLFTFFLKNPLL